MGVVYKAEDTKLKRTVVRKFLPPELTPIPDLLDRFMREAQVAAALDHPNICTVYESDETEETSFLSTAYIEGQSIKKKSQQVQWEWMTLLFSKAPLETLISPEKRLLSLGFPGFLHSRMSLFPFMILMDK